jgi:hypothetical protein
MKTSVAGTMDVLQKIESIEKDVMELKLSVLKGLAPAGKKVVSFRGILKNVRITDSDISAAKNSLCSKIVI